MKVLDDFLIQYTGLKVGKHNYHYSIDKTFFKDFDYCDFEDLSTEVDLVFDKKLTHLELNFKHKGTATVPCDITNEVFELPLKGKLTLLVKFGEVLDNSNDEVLILPHSEYQLHVAQYIYEMIILSMPSKRIHPKVTDGSFDELLSKHLLNYQTTEGTIDESENKETDPRWEKLKGLITDKKNKNGTS